MKDLIDWEFVSSLGAPEEGIHNPMIEHFTGSFNYHLAREIIQNSLDAKIPGSNEPVLVSFDLLHIEKNDFPGHRRLSDIFELCHDSWKEDKEAIHFFKHAIATMKKETIPFLKVSDYNTKGLSGSDEQKKGSWHSLVKSRGSSSKTGGEGGSYGIGKGAAFAASDLRVVFYSTNNESGNGIFQGVAELVSHNDNSEIKRGIGSYGIGQSSVRKPEHLARNEKFWRKKETGTDIFIAGYKATRDWKNELIKSVLRNFWYAIAQNDLQVKVGDEDISSKTIEYHLVHFFQNEQLKDHIDPIGNPLQYYKAVKEGKPFPKAEIPFLNTGTFYFMPTTEHMNYVAMMRKSHMVIFTKRYTFQGNFAGVFICDDKDGNQELRVMEPPAHDKWDAARHPNGKEILDEINTLVRSSLDSMKEIQSGSILEIPELNKILPFDEESDSDKSGTGNDYTGKEGKEETSRRIPEKMVFERRTTITPYKVSVFNTPTIGNTDDGAGGGDGKGKRGKKGTKGGGQGEKKSIAKQKMNARSFVIAESNDTVTYRLVLKPNFTSKANLKINAVGEVDFKDKVEIKKATSSSSGKYHISGNQIHNIDFDKDSKLEIDVELNSPFKYSLKFEHHAV